MNRTTGSQRLPVVFSSDKNLLLLFFLILRSYNRILNDMPIFTPPSPALQKAWWKETIVYQIYPRSFKDSNDDGIGDLNGITEKLDYLHGLGIETLWLNPIFASPNADNGYDISDYRQIMPDFGTMEDFDRLLKETHARGMRLLLDLVLTTPATSIPGSARPAPRGRTPTTTTTSGGRRNRATRPTARAISTRRAMPGVTTPRHAPTTCTILPGSSPTSTGRIPRCGPKSTTFCVSGSTRGSMDSGWIRFHTLQKTRRFRRSTSASTRTCSPTTRSGRTCTTTCTK